MRGSTLGSSSLGMDAFTPHVQKRSTIAVRVSPPITLWLAPHARIDRLLDVLMLVAVAFTPPYADRPPYNVGENAKPSSLPVCEIKMIHPHQRRDF